MANNITEPDVGSQTLIPAGILEFSPWPDDANPRFNNFFDMGENDEFNLTFEAEDPIERATRRNKSREIIFSRSQGLNRGGGITTLSITRNNLEIFLSGASSTVTQGTTPVTNEEIYPVSQDRLYYLGVSSSDPVGIKGASSITLTNYPSTIAAWTLTTAYVVGDYVEDTGSARIYRAISAGTTGGTEPASFGTSALGDEITDATVTWLDVGAKTAMTAGTHYEIDDTQATGARFKLLGADIGAVFANYTPTAGTFNRIVTGEGITKTGTLRFRTDNDGGVNTRWTFPKVTLSPGGDLSFLNDGSEFQSLPFSIVVLVSGSLKAMYRDEIPA